MESQAMKDAKKIVEKIYEGNWRELIRIQTMKNRDCHHDEVVKNILFLLRNDKLTSETILERSVYLVSLVRYFGIKDLNDGRYFREKKDCEEFVRQYNEMMKNNPDLQREEGEKIRILEKKLILEEEVPK